MAKTTGINAIDIGSSKITCLITVPSQDGQKINVVGVATVPSRGVKKGQIVNIPDLAILYSIFRYAEKQKRKQLVASELITTKDSTPYWVYGLEYNAIKAILIRLASQYPDLFYAEFSGNLDNIILSNDKNSLDVVKAYIKSNS